MLRSGARQLRAASGAGLNPRGSPFGWFRSGTTGQLSSRPTAKAGPFPLHGDSTVSRAVRGAPSHWDASLKEPLIVAPSMIKVPPNKAPVVQTANVSMSTAVGGIKVFAVTPVVTTPVASIGLFLPTGSRNETHHTRGASHFLKHMAYKGNKLRSSIETIRELEQLGATLDVLSERDYTAFTSSFMQDDLPFVLSTLSGMLVPKLPEWEVNDTLPEVEREAEAAAHNAGVQLVDALHREAFRGSGLAHSLQAPLWNLHHLNNDVLQHFVAEYYRYDQAVLVTVGVAPELAHSTANTLLEFAVLEQGKPHAAPAPRQAAAYVGGEARIEGAGDNRVAVAFEGAARTAAEVPAFEVLNALLGTAAAGVGRPTGLYSRLGAIIRKHGPAKVHEGGAFHFQYADAGLFGAYLAGHASSAQLVSALQTAFKELKDVREDEFETAKKRAKLRVATQHESALGYATWLGEQALAGSVDPELVAPLTRIDYVTLADVQNLAARLASSKPTVAAYGDVSHL